MKSVIRINPSITDRNTISVKDYLKDISKIPLITEEEELELCKRIQEGDEEARKKLIESNLRFVISCAKIYQYKRLPLEDLIQSGNIGLINATKTFNPDFGLRFLTYAVYHIKHSIVALLNDRSRTIRIPHNRLAKMRKIKNAINSVEIVEGRIPTEEEIVKLTELNIDDVHSILNDKIICESLDAPLSGDNDAQSLLDIIPAEQDEQENKTANEEKLNIVLDFIEELPVRERAVLSMLYGINCESYNLEEAGKFLGITGERVRQLKEKAFERIKKKIELQKFDIEED